MWLEAGISITKAKVMRVSKTQWARPVVFHAPYNVTALICKLSWKVLMSGTAHSNRLIKFDRIGPDATLLSIVRGHAGWQISGSIRLSNFAILMHARCASGEVGCTET